MTLETTARLGLPLLAAGQAQKEIVHNEALARADFLINPVAEAMATNAPPGAPAIGQCWIVGTAPTGAWVGQAGALACWSAGGWRFAAPFEGLRVWVRGAGVWAVRGAAAWSTGAALTAPSGGSVTDTEARATVAAIVTILRHHGLIAA